MCTVLLFMVFKLCFSTYFKWEYDWYRIHNTFIFQLVKNKCKRKKENSEKYVIQPVDKENIMAM